MPLSSGSRHQRPSGRCDVSLFRRCGIRRVGTMVAGRIDGDSPVDLIRHPVSARPSRRTMEAWSSRCRLTQSCLSRCSSIWDVSRCAVKRVVSPKARTSMVGPQRTWNARAAADGPRSVMARKPRRPARFARKLEELGPRGSIPLNRRLVPVDLPTG